MALPILTVVGATGLQGGSVISFQDAEKPCYHIRALTSNAATEPAARIATMPHVTVVQVDLGSLQSLISAFEGSTAIFANTHFSPATFLGDGAEAAQELEEQQGLNIVRAASQTTSLQHLVWSTLPDAASISGGKYVIPHFQSKLPAERFILDSSLANKTSFLSVGLYGSNLTMEPYRPILVSPVRRSGRYFLPLRGYSDDSEAGLSCSLRLRRGLLSGKRLSRR